MLLGLDLGSTTVKYVLLDDDRKILARDYRRHKSDLILTVRTLLSELNERFPGRPVRPVLSGSGALAVGVLVISLTSESNTNVSNYMFGSILTVSRADAWLSVALCAAVLACCTLFYPRFFAVTFDETFMRATGGRAGRYNLLLAVLTAVTVVLGMRMMGALLISSLIIFPPLAAMRVFRTFKSVTVCSAVLSVACFIIGMTASYALETPSGASVVCADILAFALFALIGRIKR